MISYLVVGSVILYFQDDMFAVGVFLVIGFIVMLTFIINSSGKRSKQEVNMEERDSYQYRKFTKRAILLSILWISTVIILMAGLKDIVFNLMGPQITEDQAEIVVAVLLFGIVGLSGVECIRTRFGEPFEI